MQVLKKVALGGFLTVIGCAAHGFSVQTAIDDYISRAGDRFGSLQRSEVTVLKEKINRDNSIDLQVYDGTRCSSKYGCLIDIYLCNSNDADCKEDDYCFAGALQEGKSFKEKGASMTCNSKQNK